VAQILFQMAAKAGYARGNLFYGKLYTAATPGKYNSKITLDIDRAMECHWIASEERILEASLNAGWLLLCRWNKQFKLTASTLYVLKSQKGKEERYVSLCMLGFMRKHSLGKHVDANLALPSFKIATDLSN